ncbi:MAG: hypothetical protein ACI4DW_05740 [Lachnospiraceae bacterium]
MGDKNERKHFSSPYISYRTVEYWLRIQKEFGFLDSSIETTVQNYGSTVSLICNYCEKDFLMLTEEDATQFFSYLEERIMDENNRLSPQTVHTYKKNLNSVGGHFEALARKDGDTSYQNPFRKKIGKTAAVKEAEREYKRLQRRDRVKQEDVLRILRSVKEQENIQYYFILCMIAFCGVESHEICEMKPSQLHLEKEGVGEVLYFDTPVKKMVPKTKPVKTAAVTECTTVNSTVDAAEETTKKAADGFRENLYQRSCLPEQYNEEFAAYYKENRENLLTREFVFYNRNHNPVNFKTISSVLKKHKELLKIDYPLTTKELCNSCQEREINR